MKFDSDQEKKKITPHFEKSPGILGCQWAFLGSLQSLSGPLRLQNQNAHSVLLVLQQVP